VPLNPIATFDRKIKLCSRMDLAKNVGLEFGPLSRPVVTKAEGDVRYVDAMTTAELRKQFEKNTQHDLNELVEINYVWNGEGLRQAVGPDIYFDYSIASHVIEHTPDAIGWLNDMLSVLHDGGILALAVPDKRFTFDVMRPVSPCALFIDNWLRKERRPTPAHVFDAFSQVVKVELEEFTGLSKGILDPKTLTRIFTDESALALTRETLDQGLYRDCHTYVFTPRSFLEVLRLLISTGILKARILDFYDTAILAQEFIAVLQKTDEVDVSAELTQIDEMLAQLPVTPERN
jgi:hypothetical protein